ncbi:MAG: SMI1/KNR4 family protein [Akkermansiaceae bacterium]|nr:SMI1/KNR4 family protein [Armatimonadota bacterium]
MRQILFQEGTCAGPFSQEQLEGLERFYHVRLDPHFVEMSKRCNGGVPVLRNFDVVATGRERMIDRFLCVLDSPNAAGVGHHAHYDIGVTMTYIGDRLRDWLVPFAVLFAGDMLCFQYRAEYNLDDDPDDETDDDGNIIGYLDTPMICVWDHEASEELRPALYWVADSFEQFSYMLK